MFEIWDADSRNVIRFFSVAVEAENVLSAHQRERGLAVLDGPALIHEDDRETSELSGEGQAIPAALSRLRDTEGSAPVHSGQGRRIAE